MDRDEALDRLPFAYAEALRLSAAGLDHEAIASALGVAPAAVGPLLEIGAAKLARLLSGTDEPDART